MGIPITINGHELTTFDLNVEPNAEYLVTVGKTASSVKVERVIAEPDDALIEENKKLRELVRDYYEAPCVECHPWDEGWHGCKHCSGGDCTLAMRAIELGIEVEQ